MTKHLFFTTQVLRWRICKTIINWARPAIGITSAIWRMRQMIKRCANSIKRVRPFCICFYCICRAARGEMRRILYPFRRVTAHASRDSAHDGEGEGKRGGGAAYRRAPPPSACTQRGGNGERRSGAHGVARSHWRVLYHIRRDEITVRTKSNCRGWCRDTYPRTKSSLHCRSPFKLREIRRYLIIDHSAPAAASTSDKARMIRANGFISPPAN